MRVAQFARQVIRPTLTEIERWSPRAEKLMAMIAAHESGGLRTRTQDGGPALSFYQIEPQTFFDTLGRYGAIRRAVRRDFAAFVGEPYEDVMRLYDGFLRYELNDPDAWVFWQSSTSGSALLDILRDNDRAATVIARWKLAMDPEAIPHVADLDGLAAYAKRVWNGPGKATPAKYRADFLHHCPPAEWPSEWGPAPEDDA